MNYRRELDEYEFEESLENVDPLTVKCRICKQDVLLRKAEKTGGGQKITLFTCKKCLRQERRMNYWIKMRGFLRASRMHSAPFTTAIMFMAYLSYNGEKLVWMTIILPIILFLIHMFSYAHNSIVDTLLGYDIEDGNKKHGYVDGTLDKQKGIRNINWLFTILGSITLIISFFAANTTMAFLGFGMFTFFGFIYNVGQSKEAKYGFITMAISYIGLAIWSFALSNPIITVDGVCLFIYVGIVVLVQIAIFGELKDIEYDKYSIVRDLDIKIENGKMIHTWKTQLIYGLSRLLMIVPIVFTLVISYHSMALWRFILCCLWVAFAIIMFGLSIKYILREQEWNRRKIFLMINIIELIVIFLPFPLFVRFTWTIVIAISTLLLWVIINKIIWNDFVQKV